jgi:hypothetical protein
MSAHDFDMDESLTLEVVCNTVGARESVVMRLAQQGLLESTADETGRPLLPQRAVVQLRRMQRLRRDLGVNFAGAAVIIDLVRRIEALNRELENFRE